MIKKLSFLFFVVTASLEAFTQDVILFEDFEGAVPGWSKSTPHTNEWYVLNMNSSFTAGTGALAVSNDGINNSYSNGGTGSAAWVSPSWPAGITSQTVKIQFDLRVEGEKFLAVDYDFMEVRLVDLDPGSTVPTPANINGSNSRLLTKQNELTNWVRVTLTLTAANKSFINSSLNNTLLVFTWENDGSVINNPAGAIDNVLITAESSTNPPLAGNYLVGRTGTNDFASITNAVNYLNNYGLSDDVNFYLTDEDYNTDFETFPFEIGDGTATPFPGMGTYNITIKPDPATNPTPTITKSSNTFSGDVDSHGVFTLWGVSNLTIDGANTMGGTSRDLTIIDNLAGSGTSAPMAVYLAGINESDAMQNIIIKNSNLSTGDQTNGYGIVAGLHGTTVAGHFNNEAVFDNITIENNSISKVREAIHIDGVDRSFGGYTSNSYAMNIDIIENQMESAGTDAILERGIHILGVDGGSISRNTIGNFDQTDLNADVGIMVDKNSSNLIIERNEIYNLGFAGNTTSSLSAHGMDIYSGVANSAITIKNNVIRNISGNGANSTANSGYFNPTAIFLGLGGEVGQLQTYTQSGIDIYSNSIYLFGDQMDFTTSVSMGLAVAANTTGVDFRNNIIKNTLGGDNPTGGNASALALYAETSSAQFDDLNYNAYHIDAGTTYTDNYIGLMGTLADLLTDANTDMAAWRTTTSAEGSSFHGDPGFTSTTNLLPDNTTSNSWNVHGMGQPISTVNNDFTNAARSTTELNGSPDVGAYEFTNDPITNPPVKITEAGPLATNTPYLFNLNERQWVEILFNTGSDLPDDLSVQFVSGTWPADGTVLNVFNYYLDVTATENANTDYDYNITMYYDESFIGSVPNETEPSLQLTQDPTFTDSWTLRSSTKNMTNNSMQANNMQAFGRFSGTSDANPLPVEWVSFGGYEGVYENVLEWVTATEINSDFFLVQRSPGGHSWEDIGTVKASGNTTDFKSYSFIDYDPISPVAYYRLKQVDFDGVFSYSVIIDITRDINSIDVQLFPNPFKNEVAIYNLPSGEGVDIQVYTIDGKMKFNETRDIEGQTELDLMDLDDGFYILKLSYGQEVISRKIIKAATAPN